MLTLNRLSCHYCRCGLQDGGVTGFFFVDKRFCTVACRNAFLDMQTRIGRAKQFHVRKYRKSRYWEVHDGNGELICLCVYKRGAEEVKRRLATR